MSARNKEPLAVARRVLRVTHGAARGVVAWLSAAAFAAIALHPISAVAAQTPCADYSLSRNEIARALAAARPALPRSAHLDVAFACWNPHQAQADLETPRTLTADGVQQWWAVACQRNESTWECDRAEFKQFIVANLAVGDHSHAVELNFGQGVAIARARAIASQALTLYADPASRLRDCSTIEDSAKSPIGLHRSDKRKSADEPFHVNVIRDGSLDSVWLNDVGVFISFDPTGQQTPCWRDVVVSN